MMVCDFLEWRGFNTKTIDVVVPCYNEEEVLDIFYTETTKITSTIESYNFNFIFVDDGSRDKTLIKMKALAEAHDDVKYISFSRNLEKNLQCMQGLRQLQQIS